ATGQTLWDVHLGQSTDGKQEATVFVFDKSRGPAAATAAAQNALKRMRTLRHPGILRYLDGAETGDAIYIAAERVVPLLSWLDGLDGGPGELGRWGLFRVAEALRFVNEDCKLEHGNVSARAVYVTRAGEWRLFGLELMDAVGGEGGLRGCVVPGYAARAAPEVQGGDNAAGGGANARRPGALDGWGLGTLIGESYNGEGRGDVQGGVPAALWAQRQQLRQADARRRMTAGQFLQAGERAGGALDSAFVRACRFLESVAVRDEAERAEFFGGLDAAVAGFPADFTRHKILPELLRLAEFGGAGGGPDAVLRSVGQIARGLDADDFAALVAPAAVRLFGSADRALRFALLEQAGALLGAMPEALVAKHVYADYATGFSDAAPAIREATVKAALAVAPRLSAKALNGDLMKQLVRAVADAEPGIRTNALICLGKLCTARGMALAGGGVSEASQRYVVCPALLQALRDAFPPVRSAALAVASACAPRWDAADIARRVIPAVAPLLVDGERPVRAAALKAVHAM
ncbi:Nuclear aminoacylation-dependent tRNA export pathway component, partial [Coemansia sp. RSA 2618]